MIKNSQVRAARALLGMSQIQLADLTKVSISTIRRIEANERLCCGARTLNTIQLFFEKKGIRFLNERGKEFGVIIKDRTPEEDY